MSKKIQIVSGVPVTYMGAPNNHFILSPSQKGMHYTYGGRGTKLVVLPEDVEMRPDLFAPEGVAKPSTEERVHIVEEENAVGESQIGEENEPETEDDAPDEEEEEGDAPLAEPAQSKNQRADAQPKKPSSVSAKRRGRPRKVKRT